MRALDYIRARPQIWEVILTGGDPLVLSPRRLREVIRALESIDHVKIVRVHTRVPVVAPARITAELVRAIKARDKATYVVLHANHPRELSARARAACARIIDAGIPMLSQSVLLRGVNDDPETLAALMRTLVETRIKPYYLHHGDLAPGTGHLRTTIPEGQALIRALHGRLSGLCQPTYVLDIPGGHGKSPIGPSYLKRLPSAGEEARFEIEDFNGRSPSLSARATRRQLMRRLDIVPGSDWLRRGPIALGRLRSPCESRPRHRLLCRQDHHLHCRDRYGWRLQHLCARDRASIFARYIPGNPMIVIRNMPGAGGAVASTWLYQIAPRDGTAIGSVAPNAILGKAVRRRPGRL